MIGVYDMTYIPMITKKEPIDILIEEVHSRFYHSFPPFIVKGRLTTLGFLFAVGLTISTFTNLCRVFSKK